MAFHTILFKRNKAISLSGGLGGVFSRIYLLWDKLFTCVVGSRASRTTLDPVTFEAFKHSPEPH